MSLDQAAQALGPVREVVSTLEDLQSSGVLRRKPDSLTGFVLEPSRLAQGLGLLIVEAVTTSTTQSRTEAVTDELTREIEELGDSDLVSQAIAFAVCVSLSSKTEPPLSDETRLALLQTFATLRNGGAAWERARPWAFFPLNPAPLFRLVETVWGAGEVDSTARERVGYCLAWLDRGDLAAKQ
jgi:hypothetical protein